MWRLLPQLRGNLFLQRTMASSSSSSSPSSSPPPSSAKRRLDYAPPDFHVPTISLDFQLFPSRTVVSNESVFIKHQQTDELRLLGEDLQLLECSHQDFELTPSGLTLKNLASLPTGQPYPVKIVTSCAPYANHQLSGLYVQNNPPPLFPPSQLIFFSRY